MKGDKKSSEKDCDSCCLDKCKCCIQKRNFKHSHNQMHEGGSGAVYGLGMIGAMIYFIGNAPDFWMGVLGFLKAIIWPVFMVLEAFKYLIG